MKSSTALLSSMDSLTAFIGAALATDAVTTCTTGYCTATSDTSGVIYSTKPTTYYYPNDYKFYIRNWDYKKCVGDSDYESYPVCDHTILSDGTNVLEFVVAKFKRDELKIKIDDNKLIISGKREPNGNKDDNSVCIHNKIAKRDFSISFIIPEKLDITKTTSSLEDGILTVKIPMSEEMKKHNKEIEIS